MKQVQISISAENGAGRNVLAEELARYFKQLGFAVNNNNLEHTSTMSNEDIAFFLEHAKEITTIEINTVQLPRT